ncbi:max-interacting protein 1 isoform c [Pimephales promelas]|nr:max-interacting protein 1 isoform c [Pimephales promelas]
MSAELKAVIDKVASLERRLDDVERPIVQMQRRTDDMETYLRRRNLRIGGIPESVHEDICLEVIKICPKVLPSAFLKDKLPEIIDVVHRLWKIQQGDVGRSKATIMQFSVRSYRDAVWKAAKNSSYLKQNDLRFMEDFSAGDRERRRKLWPEVQKTRAKMAYFVGGRAFIQGQVQVQTMSGLTSSSLVRSEGTAAAYGRMELNSLLLLLEAAEYLERRDREAEHGYASVLPYDSDSRKKTKSSPISRKNHNNRSSHNELEKHRRAKLRLYLEQLKQLVPLGPDSTRHTTLSLLKRAKMHIKKLEEQDRKALNMKEQLQREHRYLKRRLEQLSVQGLERIRTDSMGSTISTDSEQDVDIDIEGMEFTPGENDSVDSVSDGEDHYSLQSSSSDGGHHSHSHRLQAHIC